MLRPLGLSAICTILSGVVVGLVPAEEFRIETDVFIGNQKDAIAQSVTLFASGLVYDFPLSGPEETTVFDPIRGRFVMLDAQRKVKTTLTSQELLEMMAAIKVHAQELDGVFAFAAAPRFEEDFDSQTQWVTLSSDLLVYRAKGQAAKSATAVSSYRQFADWFARLNATRPGVLPPFARLELNRIMAERDMIPEEVELTIEPKNRLIGRKLVVRSRHITNWRLSNTDRKRIETAGTQMANFQPLALADYLKSLATQAER